MKRYIGLALFALSGLLLAHDEGHGPKLTDQGKQGGIIAPVVAEKEAKLGAKASLVYKGELVRAEDGKVRVYLYDKSMAPLNLDGFDKSAKGVLETLGKKAKKASFDLKLEGNAFIGQAPKASKKPFNIDVVLTEKGESLLVAFDNLD